MSKPSIKFWKSFVRADDEARELMVAGLMHDSKDGITRKAILDWLSAAIEGANEVYDEMAGPG